MRERLVWPRYWIENRPMVVGSLSLIAAGLPMPVFSHPRQHQNYLSSGVFVQKLGHQVGRMAGQFAKSRSDPMEKDGIKLPSYKGDNINGDTFDEKSRIPDPNRMTRAYLQSTATLNLLRSFATGGYAAMQRVNHWNLDFAENSEQGDRYQELANRVDEALGFMAAAGLTVDHPIMTTTKFWTSHECLLLPYELALTTLDSTSSLYYDCSADMVWVGERTRQLDGAHVEFLRGIANPLGIKVSNKMDPNELVNLIEILNPQNKPRRITIIVRMGAENQRVNYCS